MGTFLLSCRQTRLEDSHFFTPTSGSQNNGSMMLALARSRNRRSSINQCYAKKAIVNTELNSPFMTCATAGSKAWAHSEHCGTEVSHACGIFGDWKRNEVTHKSFVSFSLHFAKWPKKFVVSATLLFKIFDSFRYSINLLLLTFDFADTMRNKNCWAFETNITEKSKRYLKHF